MARHKKKQTGLSPRDHPDYGEARPWVWCMEQWRHLDNCRVCRKRKRCVIYKKKLEEITNGKT